VTYTDDYFCALVSALRAHADESMDQFDHLRIEGRFGPVFVAIMRALRPDEAAEAYRTVSD
jgi:hypothetical protein